MPFTQQYVDALSIRPLPFNELKEIVFCEGIRNSSSRALTLKGVVDGKAYSVKFFTSPSEALLRRYKKLGDYCLKFVPEYKIYENEINIVSGDQFLSQPVVLGRWIEGVTMADLVRKLCRNYDKVALDVLCDKMINLFIDLMDTEIIHGDLKFDNIIAGEDGKLSIIDWDAYYAPDLKDFPTTEVGTVFFQHPTRMVSDYGKPVDDYSMAVMVVSMLAYSEQPELYDYSLCCEGVLLSPEEVINGSSDMYYKMCEAWQYSPLRYELLRFLASSDFHMARLKKLLLRLARKDKFDEEVEVLIDKDIPIRKIVNRNTKLFGYIDGEDHVIIDTMYGDCTMFGEMIAGVRINSKWFFIDRRGRQLPGSYQKIIAFGAGLFSVKKDNRWFDVSEKELINL